MNATRKNVQACIKTYCQKEFPKRQQAFAKKLLGSISISKTRKITGLNKKSQNTCAVSYCNPTCEGTLFQPGKGFPAAALKRKITKNNPFSKGTQKFLLSAYKTMRTKIFGKKTNVLKNGFYEKLSKQTVTDLKKKGAISGCAAAVL